jgi:predicted RNase H-like HicB family nuclease
MDGGKISPAPFRGDRSGDGRWIAEVLELPGVMTYG